MKKQNSEKLTLLLISIALTSNCQANGGIKTFPKDYKTVEGSVIQIKNMPAVKNQGALGICYAFSAATLIDEANCYIKKTPDCSSLSDSKKVSPLDISRFNQKLPETQDYTDRFNYEGIKEGGSTALTIYNAIRTNSFVSEKCSPYNQLQPPPHQKKLAEIIKTGLKNIKTIKHLYEENQTIHKICQPCAEALAEKHAFTISETIAPPTSLEEIKKSFREATYEKFIDKLLIPEICWDFKNQITLSGQWKVETHPTEKSQKNYTETIKKIKEVLKSERPLSIGFCAEHPLTSKTPEECSEKGHSVVIKGYKKICSPKNECHDSIQVHNSWGETWQIENNDGWASAKELLERTFYEKHSIVWITPE